MDDLQDQPQQARYAWYYPEGAGYLHLRNLRAGTQGTVALVMSCADKKLYVRKRGMIERRDPELSWSQYGCEEVSLYRLHPYIPKLIDWKLYWPMRHDAATHQRYSSTSTIWELCDLGDVTRLASYYEDLNTMMRQNFRATWPAPYHIPEAIIWRAFGQLLQAMSFIHRAQPCVGNHDFFAGNCFVRVCPDGRMVDFCVADFGKGATPEMYRARTRYEYRGPYTQRTLRDYVEIITIIKQLMVCMGDPWEQFEGDNLPNNSDMLLQFDLLQLACVGVGDEEYDPEIFHDEGARYPNPNNFTDGVAYQQRSQNSRLYSPELFATIRQFERRVQLALGKTEDQNFWSHRYDFNTEAGIFRDWEYLGKAIEAKAVERMETADTVKYPPMDVTWEIALKTLRISSDQAVSSQAILRTQDEIINAGLGTRPTGPFRIAEVSSRDLRVLSISAETYNTFNFHHREKNRLSPQHQIWVRNDSDHSIPHDPTQPDGIRIRATLNRDDLYI